MLEHTSEHCHSRLVYPTGPANCAFGMIELTRLPELAFASLGEELACWKTGPHRVAFGVKHHPGCRMLRVVEATCLPELAFTGLHKILAFGLTIADRITLRIVTIWGLTIACLASALNTGRRIRCDVERMIEFATKPKFAISSFQIECTFRCAGS